MIIWLLIVGMASQQIQGNGDGDGDGSFDPRPNPVFDLAVDMNYSPPTQYQITLTWTAPADARGNIALAFPVDGYEVRYSFDGPIDSEDGWSASFIAGEGYALIPKEPGNPEILTISLPLDDRQYWFSIKSRDNAGQWSDIADPSPNGWTLNDPTNDDPLDPPDPVVVEREEDGDDGEGACSSRGIAAAPGLFLALLVGALARR